MSFEIPEKELSPEEEKLAMQFYDKLLASRMSGKYTPETLMPATVAAKWFTENVGTVVERVQDPDKAGAFIDQKIVKRQFEIRDIARWVSWLCATHGMLIISSRSPNNPGYAVGLNRSEIEHTLSMLRATKVRLEERYHKMLENLERMEQSAKQANLFEQSQVKPPLESLDEEHPVIEALQKELGAEKIEPNSQPTVR